MSYSTCIKCKSQVGGYEKYCDNCVEEYGLQDKQDLQFWKVDPNKRLGTRRDLQALEQIFRDDMAGKTSRIAGTLKMPFRPLSEQVDYTRIYKVKGESGLWSPKGTASKGNMVRMYKYGGGDAITIHMKNIEGLIGKFVIIKNDGSGIPLSEAIDNCQTHFKNEPIDIAFQMAGADTIDLREKICPNYNEVLFERKHLRQLLGFYNVILQGVKVELALRPQKIQS